MSNAPGIRFDWGSAMISSFQDARLDLVNELDLRGLEMTSTAMTPLRDIDFSKLVSIYDHEERLLREVFVSSLLNAYQARLSRGRGTTKISIHDIRTAMLMLGSAVSVASEQAFSQANKSIIQDICPYCS